MDTQHILKIYRTMVTIRLTEEQLAKSHQRGLVHGACHTYIGEEAIACSVCAHISDDFKRVKAMNSMKDDIYKEWSGRALNHSSKLSKRKAVIERDLDKIVATWLSDGVISSPEAEENSE